MVYVWYIQQTDVAILSPNGATWSYLTTPSIQTHPNHLFIQIHSFIVRKLPEKPCDAALFNPDSPPQSETAKVHIDAEN